jgi:hypothetical protein
MRAAEAVHLLALENPPLSQQIGLHAWIPGMFGLAELFAMVEAGCGAGAGAGEDVLRGAEEAAEVRARRPGRACARRQADADMRGAGSVGAVGHECGEPRDCGGQGDGGAARGSAHRRERAAAHVGRGVPQARRD